MTGVNTLVPMGINITSIASLAKARYTFPSFNLYSSEAIYTFTEFIDEHTVGET